LLFWIPVGKGEDTFASAFVFDDEHMKNYSKARGHMRNETAFAGPALIYLCDRGKHH
jgi:hypothetical protein